MVISPIKREKVCIKDTKKENPGTLGITHLLDLEEFCKWKSPYLKVGEVEKHCTIEYPRAVMAKLFVVMCRKHAQ